MSKIPKAYYDKEMTRRRQLEQERQHQQEQQEEEQRQIDYSAFTLEQLEEKTRQLEAVAANDLKLNAELGQILDSADTPGHPLQITARLHRLVLAQGPKQQDGQIGYFEISARCAKLRAQAQKLYGQSGLLQLVTSIRQGQNQDDQSGLFQKGELTATNPTCNTMERASCNNRVTEARTQRLETSKEACDRKLSAIKQFKEWLNRQKARLNMNDTQFEQKLRYYEQSYDHVALSEKLVLNVKAIEDNRKASADVERQKRVLIRAQTEQEKKFE